MTYRTRKPTREPSRGVVRTVTVIACVALASGSLAGCGGEDAGGDGSVVVEGIDESFLDRSVSPCTDFYQFACGTWIAEHPTDKAPAVQRFSEGEGRTSYLLEKILEGDRQRQPYLNHHASVTLGNYYRACMNLRSGAAIEQAAFTTRLNEIGAALTPAELAQVLVTLHADGIDAFFRLDVDTDPGNPTRTVATFSAGGMGLPDRRYYFDATMSVLPQYEEHVQRMLSLLPTRLDIDPAAVLSIETALAMGADADDNTGDPVAAYNLLAFDAFTATSPNFPWAEYLRAAGFPMLSEVNVRRPAYLMKFDALWSSASLVAMKSYLLWRVLEAYAQTMGKVFVAEEARFHQGVFVGDPNPTPDWWACLQSTKWALGFALSRPYVSVVFDGDQMNASRDLVTSIKQAFRKRLDSLSWIDAATRQEAAAKLDQVSDKVGFPQVWPAEVPIDSDFQYQGNVRTVRQWYRRQNVQQLSQPVDRSVWPVPPCTTNAFYSRYRNEIVLPAAILQTPLFSIGRARALNYGAIGAVMGHELTHGFDDDGRKFDGDGKLRNWWTTATDAEFVRRSKCIADQYGGYQTLPGVAVDGVLTLGENIADLGGLKLAYAAYQASGATESFTSSFAPDAQFFLAYAQIWCANYREEVSRSRVRTDPHAPARFRVNGVVTNMPEFAAAFGCPAGAAMAPKDRCEIW
jgi:putative endopeptidase